MLNPSPAPWNLPVKSGRYIHISVERNTLVAIALSIVLHLLFLFAIPKQQWLDSPISFDPQPITVVLNPSSPRTAVPSVKSIAPPTPEVASEPEPAPEPVPEPVIEKQARKAKPAKKPIPIDEPTESVIALDNPLPAKPVIPEPPTPSTSTPDSITPDTPPPTDMMAYVNQQRAKRNALENFAAQENAAAIAREIGPSEEQMRSEIIKRNFLQGTNGLFQITSMGDRTAQFSFRGWTNEYNSKREYFQVEAAPEELQRAVVRKMIELIRRYYSGNFNWESQRLGRTVILSARQQDNDGLEDFLIEEFFGDDSKLLPTQ